LLLSLWLAVGLPESMRFLVTRGNADEHIRKILRRIAPAAAEGATAFTATELVNTSRRAPIRAIFSDGLAVGTALLWLVYFGGLVVVYFVLSWMPTLAKQHGYTLETAANISALFTLVGPVGALIAGWLMDRYSPHVIIGVCYLLGAVFLWQVGLHIDSLQLLYLSVGLAGFFINASQSTISALATRFYPTRGRATGVSTMMGVGRFGGILGAASGGYLLGHEVSFANIFLLMASAALVAGLAILFKGFYYRKWSI
jgi:AAHS family 4-hydroxybenzoate transporter-like MFS transporter